MFSENSASSSCVAYQLPRGVDEEGAEDVEEPVEPGHGLRTGRDEDTPQEEGQNDPDQEHLLPVAGRHRETAHDEQEDEQVVDAERVFGDPAREELATVGGSADQQYSRAEGAGEKYVEDHPPRALAKGRLSRVTRDKIEVDRQHEHEPCDRDQPHPGGEVHRAPFRARRRSFTCHPRMAMFIALLSARDSELSVRGSERGGAPWPSTSTRRERRRWRAAHVPSGCPSDASASAA